MLSGQGERRAHPHPTGEGLAKAGLIGSWVILGIWGLMIVGFIVFFIILAILGAVATTA